MRRRALYDGLPSSHGGLDAPSHVVVVATLEHPPMPSWLRRRRPAAAEGADRGGWLSRATAIDVDPPLADEQAAKAWLRGAGEPELASGVAVLNRALQAYRIAAADFRLSALDRRQALAARVGFGAGEEVAEGQWAEARELVWQPARARRRRMLVPDARLAAILTGQERPLAAEELALRARLDVDEGENRLAALQVLIALDAAIAELSADMLAALRDRLEELRAFREPIADAAQRALTGLPDGGQGASVQAALERIEAALRARGAARG